MTDLQTAALGQKAESELEATSAAFEHLRRAMVEELIAAPIGSAKIEKLHMGLQQLEGVKNTLMQMVLNGQIARHALAAETTLLRPN